MSDCDFPEEMVIAAAAWVCPINRSENPDELEPKLNVWLASDPLHPSALATMTSVIRIGDGIRRGATPREIIEDVTKTDVLRRPKSIAGRSRMVSRPPLD